MEYTHSSSSHSPLSNRSRSATLPPQTVSSRSFTKDSMDVTRERSRRKVEPSQNPQSPLRAHALIRQQSEKILVVSELIECLETTKSLSPAEAERVERALAKRIRNHLQLVGKCLPYARSAHVFAIRVFMAQEPKRRLVALRYLVRYFSSLIDDAPKTKRQEFFREGLALLASIDNLPPSANFSQPIRDLSKTLGKDVKLCQLVIRTLQAAVAYKFKNNLPLALTYHDSCEVNQNAQAFAQEFMGFQNEEEQLFCLVQLAKEEVKKPSGGETYFRAESFFTRALHSYFSRYIRLETVLEEILTSVKGIEDEQQFLQSGFNLICQIKIPLEVAVLIGKIYDDIEEASDRDAVVSGLVSLRYINSAIIRCCMRFEDPKMKDRLMKLTKLIQTASNNKSLPDGYDRSRFYAFQSQFLPTKACS